MRRLLRALGALAGLGFIRRAARRRAREQRAADEHRRRREEVLEEAAQVDPTRPMAEQVEELTHHHEEVGAQSPRRAEPPLTVERDDRPNPRGELLVAGALLLGALAAAGFIVFYVVFPDTQLLGLTLGLALALLAVAAAVAGTRLLPRETVAEEYHRFGDPDSQEDVQEIVEEGASSLTRRRLLLGSAGVAGLTLGAAALVPAASLGPNVGDAIHATPWRRGRTVVDRNGDPITVDQVAEGAFVNGFPEGASREELGSPVVVVRLEVEQLELSPERLRGAPEGLLAFSQICPHAACAITMYRHPTYPPNSPRPALVCPCHFSTFDPARGGKLLFGPAGRALPQLPLQIGLLGALEAAGDYFDAVGPSYGGIRRPPERPL